MKPNVSSKKNSFQQKYFLGLILTNQHVPREVQKSCTWGAITPCTQTHRGTFGKSGMAGKNMEVLTENKLSRNQKCTCAAKNPTSWVALDRRLMEAVLSLHSALLRPHLHHCVQFWLPGYKTDIDIPEQDQWKRLRDWSVFHTRGWKHCSCLAWRREQSGRTSVCISIRWEGVKSLSQTLLSGTQWKNEAVDTNWNARNCLNKKKFLFLGWWNTGTGRSEIVKFSSLDEGPDWTWPISTYSRWPSFVQRVD